MSKIIKFTQELLEQATAEFVAEMKRTRAVGGSVSYNKTFDTGNAKATLRFTELAWLKMKALVAENSKEVAWHGVAERCEDNVYLISDILVYPQSVTGASVDMDTEAYTKWIQDGIVSGDERFNHFYAQGHSHVDFAVTPSPTDLGHQKEILSMVRDTGFYVFMIWNKKNDRNVWIYDLGKNILFENADVTVEIIEQPNGVVQFLRDANAMVKTRVPVVTQQTGGTYGGGSSYYSGLYRGTGLTGAGKSAGISNTAAGAGQKKKVTAHVDRGQSGGFDDEEEDPHGPFFVRDYYHGDDYYGLE